MNKRMKKKLQKRENYRTYKKYKSLVTTFQGITVDIGKVSRGDTKACIDFHLALSHLFGLVDLMSEGTLKDLTYLAVTGQTEKEYYDGGEKILSQFMPTPKVLSDVICEQEKRRKRSAEELNMSMKEFATRKVEARGMTEPYIYDYNLGAISGGDY